MFRLAMGRGSTAVTRIHAQLCASSATKSMPRFPQTCGFVTLHKTRVPPFTTVTRRANKGLRRSFSYRLRNVNPHTVIYGIMAINVGVWGLWNSGNYKVRNFLYKHFTVSTVDILKHGRIHTLLTSVFSHVDGQHLLVNMITLYFFGLGMAQQVGPRRFLAFYVIAGTVGSAVQAFLPLVAPRSWGQNPQTVALGASGAVNGTIIFNCLLHPRNMILVMFVIPVPAALFGVLYVFHDLYGLSQQGGRRGQPVGYGAHLGGAACGLLAYVLRRRLFPFI